MIGSLWRYSHFLLAIISALFLIIASITGAILAIEPIAEISKNHAATNLDNVSVSEVVTVLKDRYSEVLELEITPENFVKASVFTKKSTGETLYINASTGDKLGEVVAQSVFFNLITNVHRSLFLKSLGRGIMGFVSFLLCFITVTGLLLLAERQGGFQKWFSKVRETDFGQRYHIIFGRWFLIPLVIVAATGVYLSAEKFSLLPKSSLVQENTVTAAKKEQNNVSQSDIFNRLKLSEVRKITFPFSEDPEDYFQVALHDKELRIDQYTGEIISEVSYPFVQLASRWSMEWHTGQGSIRWSIILLLSSLSLLFFIFSGLSMGLKRTKNSLKMISTKNKDEAEYIILVGSETRNTFAFANAFNNALLNNGKSVFMSNLNDYDTYKSATHLIVFTATYGAGHPPNNALKFEALFNTTTPKQNLKFTVLGFGSLLYPQYCHFALKVDSILQKHEAFTPLIPLVKINNQSQVAFKDWVKAWNAATEMKLTVVMPFKRKKKAIEHNFEVLDRTSLNINKTFLLKLKPPTNIEFQSGDLISIIPPNSEKKRSYSIAKIGDHILLSIKWHEQGLCSEYLSRLTFGDSIAASIQQNKSFHLPQNAPAIFGIANGTGIAPFLGMATKNKEQAFHLLWGGRVDASFKIYEELIVPYLKLKSKNDKTENTTRTYQVAYSQMRKKEYVQDILLRNQEDIAQKLCDGCVFMICGSMTMQQEVLNTLDTISKIQLQQPLSDFENNNQLLLDCY